MADNTPNKARIQSMLDDLADKQGGSGGASSAPASSPPPTNLPTSTPHTPMTDQPQSPAVATPQRPTTPAPAPVASAPSKQTAPPAPPTPSSPVQPKPTSPPSATNSPDTATTNEVRTMTADVEKLRTGQAPAPVTQPQSDTVKPAPDTAKSTESQHAKPVAGGVIIPEKASGGMGRKFIFAAVGLVILIVVVFAGLTLLRGSGQQVATPSPTTTPAPTLSRTPAPTTKDLSFYFGQLSGTLVFPSPATRTDIRNAFATLTPTGETAVNIELQGTGGFPTPMTEASSEVLGTEAAVLVYGQTEIFGEFGQPNIDPQTEARLIYVAEILDATAANQLMTTWEEDPIQDAELLDFDESRSIVIAFSDASYRQIPVRYRNFPYADKSLDWAIVPASNGKNYLVITNSRQSIFYAIDQLLK